MGRGIGIQGFDWWRIRQRFGSAGGVDVEAVLREVSHQISVLFETYDVLLKTNSYTGGLTCVRKRELAMGAVAERQVTASQDRGALAKMVMTLFDHWKLSTEDQATLLGIATSNRAALSNYRSGKPIGTSRDQYERVGHLLGIHKNLRLLFPKNRDLAYRWMSTRNKAFDNLTPVEVVKEWGFAGLLMVRGYLDRARGV